MSNRRGVAYCVSVGGGEFMKCHSDFQVKREFTSDDLVLSFLREIPRHKQ